MANLSLMLIIYQSTESRTDISNRTCLGSILREPIFPVIRIVLFCIIYVCIKNRSTVDKADKSRTMLITFKYECSEL